MMLRAVGHDDVTLTKSINQILPGDQLQPLIKLIFPDDSDLLQQD